MSCGALAISKVSWMLIDVVYHVLAVNHWQSVVREQLALLLPNRRIRSLNITLAIPPAPVLTTASGRTFQFSGVSLEQRLLAILAEVRAATVGFRPSDSASSAGSGPCSSAHPEIRRRAMDEFEHPSMERVDALARGSDGVILYCHAKGVSYRPPEPQIENWRLHMNQLLANADHWALRLADGPENVAGPCLLNDDRIGIAYFAGNFWMARADYLRELPEYSVFRQCPPTGWHEPNSRFLAELAVNRGGAMKALAVDGRSFTLADVKWLD